VESIYKAIIQREAVESIESQRTQMIASLFANPNWDGDNADKRTEQIRTLNEHFNKAIESIYFPKGAEPDIDWDNPFYAAAKRGLQRTREKYGIDGKSMGEVIEMTTAMDQEQIRARIESRQAIDQT